ncbi:MAG: hypothetical protein HDS66_06715 [Bacteroidales bacterium]|nr:hypothetical protein [Bacteroidales bacterium]
MKTTSARYIDATEETTAKLAKSFKCTPKFVYLALTYRSDTATARKIRFTAVENYGATPMCHYPECETLHNVTKDGRELMVQNFNNGVHLEIDKQTGEVVVYDRKGRVLESHQIEAIPELTKIQIYAESL